MLEPTTIELLINECGRDCSGIPTSSEVVSDALARGIPAGFLGSQAGCSISNPPLTRGGYARKSDAPETFHETLRETFH